jgi:hypothetical protein
VYAQQTPEAMLEELMFLRWAGVPPPVFHQTLTQGQRRDRERGAGKGVRDCVGKCRASAWGKLTSSTPVA